MQFSGPPGRGRDGNRGRVGGRGEEAGEEQKEAQTLSPANLYMVRNGYLLKVVWKIRKVNIVFGIHSLASWPLEYLLGYWVDWTISLSNPAAKFCILVLRAERVSATLLILLDLYVFFLPHIGQALCPKNLFLVVTHFIEFKEYLYSSPMTTPRDTAKGRVFLTLGGTKFVSPLTSCP